jgi:hypothetical protein
MRKVLYISVLLMALVSDTPAQKKIIYEDTGLLQKEEPAIDQGVEEVVVVPAIQDEEKPEQEAEDEEPPDTTLYKNDLNFSYDSIKNWRNSKTYAYSKYLDSLLKARKQKEPRQSSFPRSNFFSILFNSSLTSLILWTLAIGFVLFIVYRLFLADGAFRRKAKQPSNLQSEAEEEIITPESNFDLLIRQALQHSNYRQAVRYHYLRTLHLLAGKNLLQLAPDKTNYEYVRELANRSYQQDFAALTLNYEYVWYGEFEIDKQIYNKIDSSFTGFNKKI